VEFERPGNNGIMHRDGDRPTVEPICPRGLIAPLEPIEPLAEDCPGIDDPVSAPGHVS